MADIKGIINDLNEAIGEAVESAGRVDVNSIIESINRRRASSALSGKVYRDEPVIIKASQMKNASPSKYREMRALAHNADYRSSSSTSLFMRQAKFMEDFEDDYPYGGEFSCYFPTYTSMSELQLRGYFTWRAAVRRGDIKKTSLSYAFVYMYELINLIGAASPEDAYAKFVLFCDAYVSLDEGIKWYYERWRRDFVVFYGLDKALLANSEEDGYENAVLVLMHPDLHTEHDVFTAVNTLSAYKFASSRMYKERPKECEEIIRLVLIKLSEYYSKKRSRSLCESLFGSLSKSGYQIFLSAVFDRRGHADCEYVVNELCRYSCKNSEWYVERMLQYSGESKRFGGIIKTVDYLLREKTSFKSRLQPGKASAFMQRKISEIIDEYLAEKKKESAPKISIDVSKLQGIREISLKTQDRLIVEEDGEEPQAEMQAEETAQTESGYEYELIRCLLYGKPYAETVKRSGKLLSVLAESANEIMLDVIGDTVLEFDGDNIRLVEDYISDLKGIIKE